MHDLSISFSDPYMICCRKGGGSHLFEKVFNNSSLMSSAADKTCAGIGDDRSFVLYYMS
jgi:hypothetical protein